MYLRNHFDDIIGKCCAYNMRMVYGTHAFIQPIGVVLFKLDNIGILLALTLANAAFCTGILVWQTKKSR